LSVTHSTAARNAATDAVTALIGVSGRLKFHITGSTVAAPTTAVANLALSATAFGASASGTATANAIASDTNAVGGTVAFASLQTSGGVAVIHCAVAASGSDIDMTNGLAVTAGDTIACSGLTYTALSA
jgi:hypothetical protein